MPAPASRGRLRRVGSRILCGWLCVLATAGAWARSGGSPPDGLKIGKLVIAPFAWTTFQLDDNVFRSSNPEEDVINTFGFGADVVMPIRNSEFQMAFEAIKRAYQVNTFTRSLDFSLDADLVLNFSTFDTLTVRNEYYYGFTDVSRTDFDSGDAVFTGVPFQALSNGVEILRGVSNEKGYYFRFSREHLRYDSSEAEGTAFNDYDGYNLSAEYRQPFANYKWLVVYGNWRDYDYSRPQDGSLDFEESAATVQVGLRGVLGGVSPFLVRVGYGTSDYQSQNDSEPRETFAGMTVRASLGLLVGGRTNIDFQFDRRALPSNFNTSYSNTRFTTTFSRPVLRSAWVSVDLRYDLNVYNDPLRGIPACNGGMAFNRRDRRYGATANFDWGITNRLNYFMGVAFDSRSSTCDVFSFNSTVLTAGVSTGW